MANDIPLTPDEILNIDKLKISDERVLKNLPTTITQPIRTQIETLSIVLRDSAKIHLADIQQTMAKVTAAGALADKIKVGTPTSPNVAGLCGVLKNVLDAIGMLDNFTQAVMGALAAGVGMGLAALSKILNAGVDFVEDTVEKAFAKINDAVQGIKNKIAQFFSGVSAWKDKVYEFIKEVGDIIVQIVNPCDIHIALMDSLPLMDTLGITGPARVVRTVNGLYEKAGGKIREINADVMSDIVHAASNSIPLRQITDGLNSTIRSVLDGIY